MSWLYDTATPRDCSPRKGADMPQQTPAIQTTLHDKLARETARLKAQQRKIRALHEQRYLAVGRLLESLGCLWVEDADLEAIVRAGMERCARDDSGSSAFLAEKHGNVRNGNYP